MGQGGAGGVSGNVNGESATGFGAGGGGAHGNATGGHGAGGCIIIERL